jgi:tRNA A37 threonylcarbamoyladenosine modification protein TsaB
MNILLISWSQPDTLYLRLYTKTKTSELSRSGSHLDTVLLDSINTLLKKNKLPLNKLSAVGVVRQDMSLASLRLLLSAVNSLAWALGLSEAWISEKQFENPQSVKWPKKTVLLKPTYARPPTITTAK